MTKQVIEVRCNQCGKEIKEEIGYMYWLSLMNYFECEYLNGDITKELYECMVNRVMMFKPYMEEKKS